MATRVLVDEIVEQTNSEEYPEEKGGLSRLVFKCLLLHVHNYNTGYVFSRL